MDLFNATGLQRQSLGFREKYWRCVSPGTKTTPKGNWTEDCDGIAEDVTQLIQLTLQSHDTYLRPCSRHLKIHKAAMGRCAGGADGGLGPKDLQAMWDDWQSIAFADKPREGAKFATACIAAGFAPGCGGPAPLRAGRRELPY